MQNEFDGTCIILKERKLQVIATKEYSRMQDQYSIRKIMKAYKKILVKMTKE